MNKARRERQGALSAAMRFSRGRQASGGETGLSLVNSDLVMRDKTDTEISTVGGIGKQPY
jgi:hypothetical protein